MERSSYDISLDACVKTVRKVARLSSGEVKLTAENFDDAVVDALSYFRRVYSTPRELKEAFEFVESILLEHSVYSIVPVPCISLINEINILCT